MMMYFYGNGNPIPQQLKDQMQAMRNAGEPVKVIADKCGVGRSSVETYTISPRRRLAYGNIPARNELIVKLRDEDHLKWKAIGQKFLLSPNTCQQIYRRIKHERNQANR